MAVLQSWRQSPSCCSPGSTAGVLNNKPAVALAHFSKSSTSSHRPRVCVEGTSSRGRKQVPTLSTSSRPAETQGWRHLRRHDVNRRTWVTSISAGNGEEVETTIDPTERESTASYDDSTGQGTHQSVSTDVHQEHVEQQRNLWSVVIPTYNRLPILTKALLALENQTIDAAVGISAYEVVVVDDGSTDGTIEFLQENDAKFPHVRLIRQDVNGGPGKARNRGVLAARGEVVVFIDSDLVVTPTFLQSHAEQLDQARQQRGGDDRVFTYGRVVNTDNFEDPTAEPFKVTDMSAAFFATGNVAISRQQLMATGTADGPFDTEFSEYGWEDLELGERLKNRGVEIVQCPEAVGYHYHPQFTLDQVPSLIRQEQQRGRNGVRFFQKHPSLGVRLMVQMTPLHFGLWWLLTLGGLINERVLAPVLKALVDSGRPRAALGLLSPIL
eukprot:CAMPEP_0118950294 /NCGR_PEP_ID=MMETSP1169-20130426/51118_1 /TAXON_ID=36882 /ORGANISM="Pyramimonas obovata, Strain CCMP722" /LENGTH=439 /DNA_ID=CAMNT_0006897103 /DNA_START=1 /DNA_END=1316 /DNA_ORIENTATION=+